MKKTILSLHHSCLNLCRVYHLVLACRFHDCKLTPHRHILASVNAGKALDVNSFAENKTMSRAAKVEL